MWLCTERRKDYLVSGIMALTMVSAAGACSSVSDSSAGEAVAEANQASESEAADSTSGSGAVSDQQSAETSDKTPFLDLTLVKDPVTDNLVYACNGLVASADELEAAFGSEPLPNAQVEAALATSVGPDGFTGVDSQWVKLSSGWLIDVEPLTLSPTSFLVTSPSGDNFACSLRRAGFFNLRPIAWALDGSASDAGTRRASIESCVEPSDVVVDRRLVGDLEVFTLFASYAEETLGEDHPDCRVDGTVTIELDTSGAELVSGTSYPFEELNPHSFELLGLGVGVSNQSAQVSTQDVTCEAFEGATGGRATQQGVNVQWSIPPAGLAVSVKAGQQILHRDGPIRFEDSAEVSLALRDRRGSYGLAASPGETDSNFFLDVLAPVGFERAYALSVTGPGVEPYFVSCGSAGIDEAGAATGSTSIATDDLDEAAILFAESSVAPYTYLTFVPVCASCGSTEHHVQMLPGGPVEHEFSPSLDDQTGGDYAGMVNPFSIHAVLDKAIADGKDVVYEIDAKAGVPTSWTIDGIGAKILCIEVDTAPPDLRDGANCNPAFDLIS